MLFKIKLWIFMFISLVLMLLVSAYLILDTIGASRDLFYREMVSREVVQVPQRLQARSFELFRDLARLGDELKLSSLFPKDGAPLDRAGIERVRAAFKNGAAARIGERNYSVFYLLDAAGTVVQRMPSEQEYGDSIAGMPLVAEMLKGMMFDAAFRLGGLSCVGGVVPLVSPETGRIVGGMLAGQRVEELFAKDAFELGGEKFMVVAGGETLGSSMIEAEQVAVTAALMQKGGTGSAWEQIKGARLLELRLDDQPRYGVAGTLPRMQDGDAIGYAVLYGPPGDTGPLLTGQVRFLVAAAGVLFLLTFIFGYLISHNYSAMMSKLGNAALSHVKSRSYVPISQKDYPGEFANLVTDLNSMFNEIMREHDRRKMETAGVKEEDITSVLGRDEPRRRTESVADLDLFEIAEPTGPAVRPATQERPTRSIFDEIDKGREAVAAQPAPVTRPDPRPRPSQPAAAPQPVRPVAPPPPPPPPAEVDRLADRDEAGRLELLAGRITERKRPAVPGEYRVLFADYLAARKRNGLAGEVLEDEFYAVLGETEEQVRRKYRCDAVRLEVSEAGGRVTIKALPVREARA